MDAGFGAPVCADGGDQGVVLEDFLYFLFYLFIVKMLLFTMYVNDEYTANKMMMAAKKLGKKLGNDVEMVWQWVKDGKKMVIACDFHKV